MKWYVKEKYVHKKNILFYYNVFSKSAGEHFDKMWKIQMYVREWSNIWKI